MKTFMRLSAVATLSASMAAVTGAETPALPDLAEYEQVLTQYVREDGRVDYFGVKSSAPLKSFVKQLANVSPESHPRLFPSREAKLAYWINAYNAIVLHSFSVEYPRKKDRLSSTLGRALFFYQTKHRVGGRNRSLADIEDHSIRNAGDARIHFAIVCASAGCPALSRTAYRPETLNAQLEAETKQYFSEMRNFSLDSDRRAVRLPKIFDWFKSDFGSTDDRVLQFVARYRPQEAAQLRAGTWKVVYLEYDWTPNDIRR
jgi:hypothetical protein